MRTALALGACLAAAILLNAPEPQPRIIQLPAGVVEIASEIRVDSDTEVRGAPAGTLLKAVAPFTGRSLFTCRGARNVRFRDFIIDGNREALETRIGLPPYDRTFAGFTSGNGILAEAVTGLRVEGVRFRNMAGFAILARRSREVVVSGVRISDSGSRNPEGRNNATGGILLEEGTAKFRITGCELIRVRGNGIWTHSLYGSPRNRDGLIAENRFDTIGRDAIQLGHALRVRVEANRGARIGFPAEEVDLEHGAIPAALDTAGNTEHCVYLRNDFSEINGKCMDLDGFHDGEIRANTCRSRQPYPNGNYAIVMNNSNPDMRAENITIADNEINGALFGGIFVIGSGHVIARNRLLRLNLAHCNENAAQYGCLYAAGEPDLLRSGIYLGRGAERPAPARGNRIEDNQITGFGMERYCVVAAPGVALEKNRIERNRCGTE